MNPVKAIVDCGDDDLRAQPRTGWHPARASVVICDMWDAHHCVSAARRAAEIAPRMSRVVGQLRDRGALIIHAPSGCMQFYADTPARQRAMEAPHAEAPVRIDWNGWDAAREGALPAALSDPGPCSCDTQEPCNEGGPPYPWTRQIESIDIAPEDAVTDDGQEVYNLLEARGIEDVLVMGVHANICVLGRPFGIRQLVCLGKSPCSVAISPTPSTGIREGTPGERRLSSPTSRGTGARGHQRSARRRGPPETADSLLP